MEHRIEKGENVFIHSRAYVAGNVTLGDNANVWCGACIRGDLAPVKIGKNTNVQDNATVHVGYNVPCEIGSGVTVGHNAVVHLSLIHIFAEFLNNEMENVVLSLDGRQEVHDAVRTVSYTHLQIAQKHFAVRVEILGNGNWLGAAHMRIAWHDELDIVVRRLQ